jgi:hypothetical protein
MRFYKLCLVIIVGLVPLVLNAQIQVRLHKPPPNQLKVEHLWWVDLDNPTQSSYTVYLYAEITDTQKGLIFKARSNSFKLGPGKKRITPKDITDVSNVWYAANYKEYILRTGSVPQGTYTVCIYLMHEHTGNEMGKDCITVPVYLPGAPRLISPQTGSKLKQKHPHFSWTTPAPQPPNIQVRYKITVVEVLKGQTKEEAIGANVPVYEKGGLTTLSFDYPAAARPLEKTKKYAWQIQAVDASGFPVGKNEGRSEIWEFEYAYRAHPPSPAIPTIGVSRSVRRRGNYFEITLTLVNGHAVDFNDVRIQDRISGFQCMNKYHEGSGTSGPLGPERSCELTTSTDGKASWLNIELGNLNAHTTKRLRYYVVPTLYSSGRPVPYTIGDVHGGVLSVSYRIGDQYYNRRFEDEVYDATAEVNQAFSSADYLIVTTPQKLFRFNHPDRDDVYNLLSKMAELAKAKNGVLGYLPDYAWCWTLKNLIAPGGAWHTSVSSLEYLLIVGENDIVPTWIQGVGLGMVHLTDYHYANISGDKQPELKVGRIIGNTAEELLIPIQSSLDVETGRAHYDGSDALLISGPEDTWEAFVKNIEAGKIALLGKGIREPDIDIYHTDFVITQYQMLAKSLRILGSQGQGSGVADPLPPGYESSRGAPYADSAGDIHFLKNKYHYTLKQLAAWILWARYELSDSDKNQALSNSSYAESIINATKLNRALELAVDIRRVRVGRGGSNYGWIYTYETSDRACETERASGIKSLTSNKDLVIFSGHGDPGGWCATLDDWGLSGCPIEPINFNNTRPIVIAFACQTGNYAMVDHRGLNPSVATAFLKNNAALYFGSTEVALCSHGAEMLKGKLWRYWTKRTRFGDTVFELKRWMVLNGGWDWTLYEFNLYGDPKFGGR